MLITWLKRRKDNNPYFKLTINNSDTDIKIRRIKTLKEQSEYLIKRNNLEKTEGYFKYKSAGFQSFLLNYTVDLVFINSDNRVIKTISKFKENDISKYVDNVKFMYILPSDFIKKYEIQLNDVVEHQRIITKGWYE